jgi:hypothetical protein
VSNKRNDELHNLHSSPNIIRMNMSMGRDEKGMQQAWERRMNIGVWLESQKERTTRKT